MEVGAHTVSHPILATLDEAEARREIAGSREALQRWIDAPVDSFAYPNGKPGEDYSPANAELVRSLGFRAAVSTAWGVADAHSDPMQIPRFTPWDGTRTRFGLRLLRQLAGR
jgi:peptidoglycan/xylan/chitin deacetylase (PgdA/CDA1 family)